MKNSTSVLVLLSTIMLASAAGAADLVTKTQATIVASNNTWTGAYFFGQIGVGQTKGSAQNDAQSWTDRYPVQKCYSWEEGGEKCYNKHNEYVTVTTSLPAQSGEDNVIGLLVGAGLGYNYRTGTNLALGIEADGVYSWMNGYINSTGGTIQHQVPYILSLTARAIFIPTALPNTGIYLKGGMALPELKTSINGVSATQTKLGYTIGSGLEWQLPSMGVSVRTEAMYVKVPDQTVAFAGGSSTLKGDIWTAKAILSKPF